MAAISREKIGSKIGDFPVVTSLDQLSEYVRLRKISLVIFSTHSLSYETILQTMTRLRDFQVEFKMVPGHMEFMIGKSNIERLDSVPLIEIDYAYGRPFNRLIKRSFDFIMAIIFYILLFPGGLFLLFKRDREIIEITNGKRISIYPRKGILKFYSFHNNSQFKELFEYLKRNVTVTL